MKSNKLLWLMALMLMLSLVLAACAGDGEPEEDGSGDEGTSEDGSDEGSDEGEDTEGDSEEGSEGDAAASDNTLIINIPSDAVSLSTQGSNDVPSSNVAENIYETLTVQNENMEIEPGLAEDWEQVDDTTWEFYLREGVMFHDGTELTAEVVKANFDRLVDEEVASPRAFLFEAVESVEVVDDYTVSITTAYPYAPLLANLAHNGLGIMSQDIIEEDYAAMEEGDDPDSYINQNPVGTGPFKFESWTPGDKVVLSSNQEYWGEAPQIDGVEFQVIPETGARIANLETGAAHVADALGPDDVSRVDNTEGMSVLTQDSVSLSYVGFNVQKEPFDQKEVRQAVSMAIDPSQIVEGIYNGMGIPATGPLAPPVFGYDDSIEPLQYNLEEAQALLEEAGLGDGFETTIWTNDNPQRMDAAEYIQSALGEINIDVEIEVLEWGAYLERTANGEHDMFVLGWSTVTADADYGMYPLFHSSAVGAPGNRSFLENEELDALLEEGRRETDPEARQEIYSEAQEMLVDIAPMLYLHHQEYLLGVSDNVEGFSVDPTGIYQIKDVTIN
ncbi:glutathione ABC transporter substrate-binding protein [Halalkalibacillus sediminis]|uniref:Glutathione ABC transporter substrate-binding protein n=1 Tax=Halalkalibacillus sediminis TaxID=2018042 RepID=A0A2I0QSD5_9BACI|nr:glutathione ABC transporter substrate-binding protein [Halalkalibacillus sediminis]PKR77219.1 glutathione ABC transporter substrate-binding protein [Halalkalibacillus sediminis]